MVTRRGFIGAVVGLGAAALLGGIGGVTAKESGSWAEGRAEEEPESSGEDEPPH